VRVVRGAGAGAFTDGGLVTTGATPTGIACADLDGDSKLDLAVTGAPGTGQDNLTFLPGDGHGGFSTGQPMAVGWGAFHPVVADVDRDGHLDVVVATSGPRSIAVLYGTGTGSLGAPVQAGGIDGAAWVTVGDVTGDGLPDVLYLSNCLCDSTTTVVPNIGGSFTDSLAYSLPIGGASAQLADLDRDGILDYVVADWTGWVGIARGLPGGMAMSNSEPMALPRAATSGDLNGDGFPDVIVASGAQPGYVDVYLEFGPGAPARYSPVGLPSDVALGDFDEDGHPDVVVADQDSNVVALLRGTAGGALLPAVNHVVASSPVRLLVSDVDGDRHLDLVVATPGHPEGGLTVLHGDGHGQLAISATYAVSPLPKSIAMADVDADGIADLVVAGGGAPALTILRGLGGGAFAPVPPNPDLLWHSVASFVLLMDIDGDSRTEIVSDDLSGGLLTFRWAADGHIDLVSRQDGFGFPDAVAVGDFNGDGRPDLAVAGPKGSLVSFWMGAGEGRFLPAPRRYATTFPVMGGGADFAVPRFLLAKDFNRDGYDDLLGSNGLGYSGAVFAIAGGMR
ncbi:MAG: FG-GAP repeat domain-containing protein, partial [Myxococcales bacterium]